ncbi:unnamed protein product [Acanthoscelides obtectus]|uniref:Uncharacterized protein n=1 Tax=Acanthoscelides obtectus TaxID=200917 RepID=A0A9P0JWQ1_ACAOB|nr:unnamed protein product [Acanthoscelides obtectus]
MATFAVKKVRHVSRLRFVSKKIPEIVTLLQQVDENEIKIKERGRGDWMMAACLST